MDRKSHWEGVYATKQEHQVGWFQADPALSLELIKSVSPPGSRVIDVGGGASRLVDRLLDSGYTQLAVLDIARAALDRAQARLGERAAAVRWVEADITAVKHVGEFDVWHDRAVWHFLTDPSDRERYVRLAERTLPPGGHLIIAAFALDGPTRCSGLDVCRYDAESLSRELGQGFALEREAHETHVTPRGSPQAFFYGAYRRRSGSGVLQADSR